MKLRSGCVLDSASYSMCIKGSYFEILIDYGPPVFFLGQNHGVSLDVFFPCMPPSLCLWHVTE